MLIIDSLLVGGIKFVLTKIAAAVETELNDESSLREELLATRMRHELGEISDEELAALEGALLTRLREVKARQRASGGDDGPGLAEVATGEMRVTGIEATVGFDEDDRQEGR